MNTFHYGSGGALVCDEPIEGITQALDEDSSRFYGGKHFVAESMSKRTAEFIAKALGGELKQEEAQA